MLTNILSKLNIPLSNIDLIKINLISDINDEKIHIYDIKWNFDENIIPLLTSIFEMKPIINKVKTYICLDSIVTITHENYSNYENIINSRKNILELTSFQTDIEQNVITRNNKIKIEKMNTIKTFINSGLISRIYYNQNISSELPYNFLEDIINEYETWNIVWNWSEHNITFSIIILPNTNTIVNGNSNFKRKCKYDLDIKIIEDNSLIKSRSEHIEKIINIFGKIKSEFILD